LKLKDRFIEAMDDDLNTADAISVLFDMVREINTSINAASMVSRETIDYSSSLLRELGGVLGILQKQKEGSLDSEIEELINQRQQARKDKNWKLADEIRDKLKNMGIILEDTPQGVKWKKL
jgi:cysteinyl-tRNA synthetase